MNPMFALTLLFAVACVNAAGEQRGEPLLKLNEAIIAKYGETPCLNKVIGQRLTHPTDPHKFLRCMSLESLWIETCPDGLFYNPHAEICDWSSKPRPTTRSNEVVKNRPVLFKTRVNGESEIVEQPAVVPSSSNSIKQQVVAETPVREQVPVREVESVRPQVEATTPSLLDELRRKLNLGSSSSDVATTVRPVRDMPASAEESEVAAEDTTTRRVKLVQISPDSIEDGERVRDTTRRVQKVKFVSEDVESEVTTRRAFLKERN